MLQERRRTKKTFAITVNFAHTEDKNIRGFNFKQMWVAQQVLAAPFDR